MADFTPINTQEEFDKAIQARIQRERETVTKGFQEQITAKDTEIEGLKTTNSDLSTKLEEANQKAAGIPALEEKIRGYERASVKNRVAREIGIPAELADRLTGETEEELRKDAEAVRKLIGSAQPAAPLAGGERTNNNKTNNDDAWLSVSQALKGE